MEILFETNDIICINKPAGLLVHGNGRPIPEGGIEEPTLVDWILKERPLIAGVGEPIIFEGKSIDRPGIVHRLDRETSGVMVIAKNQEAFEWLKQQFKDRHIQKEYHAFVWGHFKEASGIIDIPIGRSSGDFRKWQAGRGTRGEERDALTKWSVVKQFEDGEGDQFSFVQLFPKTGRTHQLRVHMKYLQRPIVSDSLYAPTKREALGFTRVALHARKISLKSQDGQQIEVEAPYPEDFSTALASYGEI